MHLLLKDQIAKTTLGEALPNPGDSRLLTALTGLVGLRDARRIVHRIGSDRLRSASVAELAATCAFPAVVAERVILARDIGTMLTTPRPSTDCARAVLDHLPSGLTSLDVEVLLGFALTSNLRVKTVLLLSKGGSASLAVMPRDILTPMVRVAASAFVLVHNHPSGDPTPSVEDLQFTRSVARVAAVLGIDLVDHIVVAESGYVSLSEMGLLASAVEHPPEAPSTH